MMVKFPAVYNECKFIESNDPRQVIIIIFWRLYLVSRY